MDKSDGYAVFGPSGAEPQVASGRPSLPGGAQGRTLGELVEQCEKVMAHAWMVRTFVKHSEEVEEFPELMVVARAVFDVSRALESRRDDPARYLRMLRTKFERLRKAAEEFRQLAPEASSHTNFRQAVISMDACVEQLRSLLDAAHPLLAVPPGARGNQAGRAAGDRGMRER